MDVDPASARATEVIDISTSPTKLVAAGVLLRDAGGALLLVEPTAAIDVATAGTGRTAGTVVYLER